MSLEHIEEATQKTTTQVITKGKRKSTRMVSDVLAPEVTYDYSSAGEVQSITVGYSETFANSFNPIFLSVSKSIKPYSGIDIEDLEQLLIDDVINTVKTRMRDIRSAGG